MLQARVVTSWGVTVDWDSVARWRKNLAGCITDLTPGTFNGGYRYHDSVQGSDECLTALEFYVRHYTHSSQPVWRARFEAGQITSNGKFPSPDEKLTRGQELVWHRPPWQEPSAPRQFNVLYEDDAMLVIDKPPCLPVTPAGGFLEQTLVALLRDRYSRTNNIAPVHRLGRGTSGVIVFGKTVAACATLSRQLREGKWEKDYLALVHGTPAFDHLTIDRPIGEMLCPRFGTVSAALDHGKRASSRIDVILRGRREDISLISVRIFTGRTQQVRIHAACAGHPLVGDDLYITGGTIRIVEGSTARPGDVGYLLHAAHIRLFHPETQQPLEFVAPLPNGDAASHEFASCIF